MIEERFEEIQSRLPDLYARLKADPRTPRLALVVPSLSLDTEGMAMPEGIVHYEERMLYLLNMLRHPHCSLALCTSYPVPDSLISYYLHFLPGVPYSHAHSRLKLFSAHDWRDVPLTQKILERPILLERLRRHVQSHPNAYLTCYQSSPLEMQLAVELGIPILGTDPRHLGFGSKSKARSLFAAAGVPCPAGSSDLRTERQIGEAILELKGQRAIVIKQNHGVSGLGNAVLPLEDVETESVESVLQALPGQARCEVPWGQFLRRFERVGGVVEAFIDNATPVSVQLHAAPDGTVELLGTHEELYDSRGIYVGCKLPVREPLRPALHLAAISMGRLLAAEGVTGRFDVDFLALPGQLLGLDVNLRKGNTTYPLRTLNLLAGGSYDPETGLFRTAGGETRAYISTDKLTSPLLHGLLPEDLIDIATYQGLHYSTSSHTGAVFHMLGGLSRYGRVGVTCVGTDPEGARELYHKCLRGLEEQASGWEWL